MILRLKSVRAPAARRAAGRGSAAVNISEYDDRSRCFCYCRPSLHPRPLRRHHLQRYQRRYPRRLAVKFHDVRQASELDVPLPVLVDPAPTSTPPRAIRRRRRRRN